MLFICIDNLRAWGVAGSNNPASIIFDGVGHSQFGWGMYSFDLYFGKNFKVKYIKDDQTFIWKDSDYGYTPSARKDALENLVPFLVTRDQSLIKAWVLYQCKALKDYSKAQIYIVEFPFPLLTQNNNYGYQNAKQTLLTEVSCLQSN
jgi:hypothetical protein